MTYGDGSIDIPSLDNVIGTLTRLKESGGRMSDDFFLPETLTGIVHDFQNIDVAKLQLQTCSAALTALRSIEHVLQVILNPVAESIITLQQKCLPLAFHVGIQTLPAELLAKIFELGHDSWDIIFNDDKFPITVSHVCRRWRAVALDTPTIWGAVSSMFNPGRVAETLKRSKATKLTVSINFKESAIRPYAPIEMGNYAALPERAKWETFYFAISPADFAKESETLSALRTPMEFGSLTSLSMMFVGREEFMPGLVQVAHGGSGAESNGHFMERWAFPVLRHFNSYNVLPCPKWGETLTICEVTISRHFSDVPFDLRDVLNALKNCVHLDRLLLAFRCNQTSAISIPTTNIPVLDLQKLSYLRIIPPHLPTPNFVWTLLKAIRAPNLETMKLEIDLPVLTDPTDWRFTPTASQTTFQTELHPRSLDIRVRFQGLLNPIGTDLVAVYFLAIIHLDRLRHLTIEGPGFSLADKNLQRCILLLFYSVHTLRFVRCDALELDSLLDLVAYAASSMRERATFAQLGIKNCRGASDDREHLGQIHGLLGPKFVYED